MHSQMRRSTSSRRIENGGIRCAYHGWAFNTDGQVLDQLTAEVSPTAKHRLRERAYPIHAAAGAIMDLSGRGNNSVSLRIRRSGSDPIAYTCRWFGELHCPGERQVNIIGLWNNNSYLTK